MTTLSEALVQAIQLHEAGRLDEAEQIYRQILVVDPEQIDALRMLGVIAFQFGKHELAVEFISRAIELNGNESDFHSNLGNVFQAQGKLDEAVAAYRRALELNPDSAADHYNLGTAFKAQGKLDEAVSCFRRALETKPDYADAHSVLGNILRAQGKLDEAVSRFRRALEISPDYAEAHNNLGTAFHAQGKLDDAVAAYCRALELKPDFAEAHNNLGTAFHDQGKFDEAVAAYCRTLVLKPDFAEAHYSLGNTLNKQQKLDQAVAAYHRALELKPNYAEAHLNLGMAFYAQGKLAAAVRCFRRALEIRPDYAEAHHNLGFVFHQSLQIDDGLSNYDRALQMKADYADAHFGRSLLRLLHGDFQQGWPEYEWRWKMGQIAEREFSQPRWLGDSLGERTILLHAEQGLGDSLQFIRYAALVKKQNASATVVVECLRPLAPLLTRCPSIDQLVTQGDKLPSFEVHSPLLSLPGAFKTTLETIPHDVPYLFADPALVALWRERLTDVGGLRIGINWQGRGGQGDYRKRDIPLEFFAPLAQLPGVNLVSLQKGEGRDELINLRDRLLLFDPGDDLDTAHGAFLDTAALMMNLDLVITSDTAIPHLAGTLGVPVWVALPYVPDWRWLLDRSDSPWYPTMRIFRQTSPGNWPGVFEQITAALVDRLSNRLTN